MARPTGYVIEVVDGDRKFWFTWGLKTDDKNQAVIFDTKEKAEAIMGLCGLHRLAGYKMKVVKK